MNRTDAKVVLLVIGTLVLAALLLALGIKLESWRVNKLNGAPCRCGTR